MDRPETDKDFSISNRLAVEDKEWTPLPAVKRPAGFDDNSIDSDAPVTPEGSDQSNKYRRQYNMVGIYTDYQDTLLAIR